MGRGRWMRVAFEELGGARPKVITAVGFSHLVPDLLGNRMRATAFRLAGVSIGIGTVIGGGMRVAGRGPTERRLRIGARGWINADCYFDASAPITIGDDVAIGQGVLILTQTHERGPSCRRAGALTVAPVTIGDGCWLGARSTILPGVTIGRGSIVAAGAVVRRDVPPDTLVAGVPARTVYELADDVRPNR